MTDHRFADEPFMLADVRAFLDRLRVTPRPLLDAGNIAVMREFAPAAMALGEPPIGELSAIRDLVMEGADGPIGLRLFAPAAARARGPIVLFFHGGGFVICNADTHASMCAEIARRLASPVISVDYRLAPEHPWPAAPDDAEAATRWVADRAADFAVDPTGLVLCGDSAGANLAIVTSLALRDRPAALPVVLQAPFYPAADPGGDYPSGHEFASGYGVEATESAFFQAAYAPERGHWRACPLAADQTGMPPTLLVTAALDPLRDQGRAYAAKLVHAGVSTTYREIAGTIHGMFGLRRAIPSADKAFASVLDTAASLLK